MNKGDYIHIKAAVISYGGRASPAKRTMPCRVYQIYDKFVVLDTGKYKVCAFKSDIKNKAVIAV